MSCWCFMLWLFMQPNLQCQQQAQPHRPCEVLAEGAACACRTWLLGSAKVQCLENSVVTLPRGSCGLKKVHPSQLLVTVPQPQAQRDTGVDCVCCMALVGGGLCVPAATSPLVSRATGAAVYQAIPLSTLPAIPPATSLCWLWSLPLLIPQMHVSTRAQGKGDSLSLTRTLYLEAAKTRLWLAGVL